jgi:hypothetical protein
MTKLTITIDRGPEAKADECGVCHMRDVYADYWESRDTDAECRAFGRYGLGSSDSGELLRCPECLEAERVTAENPDKE